MIMSISRKTTIRGTLLQVFVKIGIFPVSLMRPGI